MLAIDIFGYYKGYKCLNMCLKNNSWQKWIISEGCYVGEGICRRGDLSGHHWKYLLPITQFEREGSDFGRSQQRILKKPVQFLSILYSANICTSSSLPEGLMLIREP